MSKHGHGRPPGYEDKRVASIRDFGLELKLAADHLLRKNGSADLVDLYAEQPHEVAAPNISYGRDLRHPPAGKSIREPLANMKPSAKGGEICANCGGPRSKSSASLCGACYSQRAIGRFNRRIADKWERQALHFHKYAWMVEHYVEHWFLYVGGYVPNFAHQLIEDISRWEEHIGIPFVFWDGEVQYLAVEDARDLPDRMNLPPRQPLLREQPRARARKMQSAWRYSF